MKYSPFAKKIVKWQLFHKIVKNHQNFAKNSPKIGQKCKNCRVLSGFPLKLLPFFTKAAIIAKSFWNFISSNETCSPVSSGSHSTQQHDH
jgi:hypothetical protein